MMKLPVMTAMLVAAVLTGRSQGSDFFCHNYIGAVDALEICEPLEPSLQQDEEHAWQLARARAGIAPTTDGASALRDFLATYPGGIYKVSARLLLAQCLLSDTPAEALKVLDEINPSALAPDVRALYSYHRGYALMALGEYAQAMADFDQAAKNNRLKADATFFKGYIAYRQNDFDTAISLMKTANSHTMPGAMADFYMAQMLYMQGKYAQAEQAATRAANSSADIPTQYRAEAMRIAGECAFEQQHRAEALKLLRQYRSMTDTPQRSAMYLLGTEEYNHGNYTGAIEILQSVAGDEDAMGQSALLFIGQALNATGSSDAALAAFNRALNLDFDPSVSEAAYYNYAVTRMNGARMPFSSTTEVFEQFLKRFPDGQYAPEVQEYLVTGYLTDKNYDDALASINRMHSATPKVLAAKQQVLYALGTRALAAGDYNQAVAYLNEARELSKYDTATDARASLSRGEALYRLGNYSQAVNDFNRYLKNAPSGDINRSLARYDLGYALLAQKQYKAASTEFAGAAAKNSSLDIATRADALNRLADTELYSNQIDNALSHYADAYTLRPEAGDYALYQQGVIYGYLSRPEQKINTLQRMMDEFPNSSLVPDAMLEITEAYTRQNDTKAALDVYSKLVSNYPSTEQGRRGYLQMALTRLNNGDRTGAIADYRSIVSLYPTSDEARMAVDQLKSLAAEDGTLAATASWLDSVENAPQLDISEAEALTFRVAEKDWLTEQKTSRLEKYLTDYPDGASRSTALGYMMDAAVKADRTGDALTFASEILEKYPDSRSAEAALQVKGDALHDLGRGNEALETYTLLARRASNPQLRLTGQLGVMRVARDLADNPKVIEVCENLLASTAAGDTYRSEIEYTLAQALDLTGRTPEARTRWESLSSHPDDLYGAKSAVALGQSYLDSKETDKARQTADALIDAATPHTYWLARAFIILSDVYAAEGQTFEAREYLLSLKENYPGTESDIFNMINTRLSELK